MICYFTAVCHVISDSHQTHSSTIKDLRKVLMWELGGWSHTAVSLDNDRPEFHGSLLFKERNRGDSDSEGPASLV